MARLVPFFASLLVVCCGVSAETNSQTITVDYQQRTVSPGDPTVTVRLAPSVVLDVTPASNYTISLPYVILPESRLSSGLANLATQLDVAFAGRLSDRRSPANVKAIVDPIIERVRRDPHHAQIIVRAALANELFYHQEAKGAERDWEFTRIGAKRASIEQYAPAIEGAAVGSRVVLNFRPDSDGCGTGIRDCTIPVSDTMYDVHLSPGTNRDFPTLIAEPNCGANNCTARTVVIHVDSSTNDLTFSAGAALPNLRNERYQIGASTNADGSKSLKRIHPDEPAAPHLAVFANWCWFKYPYICLPSFGITTDSSLSNGLAFLLGPTVRVRPVAALNSFYLSAGVVYGQRKAISDDFAGMTSVPSNVTKDTLLTNKWRANWYIGISFGFVSGAEQKFTGVFSGTNSKSSPTGEHKTTEVPKESVPPPSPPA